MQSRLKLKPPPRDGHISPDDLRSPASSAILSTLPKRAASCSLDLIRMQLDQELEDCPKVEKRTREYLHRTKLACGLVMSRRRTKPGHVPGSGTPVSSGSNTRRTTPAPSEPTQSRRSSIEVGEDTRSVSASDKGSQHSQLPSIKSSSAPSSPHVGIDRTERMTKDPTAGMWPAPRFLSRDRAKLSAREKIEGSVEVEFKIPPGVTWSEHVSTKPKEWCDFVLDKPKRVWNWGERLSRIQAVTEDLKHRGTGFKGEDIFQSVVEEDKKELELLAGTLRTREDEAAAIAKQKFALACENGMRRLFAEASGHHNAVSTKPAGAADLWRVDASEERLDEQQAEIIPPGKVDMRDFGALMHQLNLVPIRITKTDALNIFSNAATSHEQGSKEIGYEKFKEAMRVVAKVAGLPITDILQVPPIPEIVQHASDPMEERVIQERDAQTLSERKELAAIIEDLEEMSGRAMPSPGSASTWNIQHLTAKSQLNQGEVAENNGEDELKMLESIRQDLDELDHSFVSATDFNLESKQQRRQFGRELKDLADTAQREVDVLAGRYVEETEPEVTSPSRKPDTAANDWRTVVKDVDTVKLPQLLDVIEKMDEFLLSVKKSQPEPDEDAYEDGRNEGLAVSKSGQVTAVGEARRQLEEEAKLQLEILCADGKTDSEALDLIEEVFAESGIECNDREVSRLLPAARNPFELVGRELMRTLGSYRKQDALLPILNALRHHAHEDAVVPIMRKFLGDLQAAIPTPARDASWAFRLAATATLSSPTRFLVQQPIACSFKYRNSFAERAAQMASGKRPPFKACALVAKEAEEEWKKEEAARANAVHEDLRIETQLEMERRLKSARGLLQHSAGDWIAICRLRGHEPDLEDIKPPPQPTDIEDIPVKQQDSAEAQETVRAALSRLAFADLIVDSVLVPPENEGKVFFPHGVAGPGRFEFQYYPANSHVPLATSEPFEVACPEVFIKCPKEIEIGKAFVLTFAVSNCDFDAVRKQGGELPQMHERDSIRLYQEGDDSTCFWQSNVPVWVERTTMRVEHLNLTSPGDYVIKYIVGSLANHIAGTCHVTVKLPRRSTNRFASVESDVSSLQEVREARIFFSLNTVDMVEEMKIIMSSVVNELQKQFEDRHITCTCVCMNWRQEAEEEAFAEGSLPTIRQHLLEIDCCRPFFVGILGDRYGHVPPLTAEEEQELISMYEEYPFLPDIKNPHVPGGLGFSLLELEILYATEVIPAQRAVVLMRDSTYICSTLDKANRDVLLNFASGLTTLATARSAMTDLKMRFRGFQGEELQTYLLPKDGMEVVRSRLAQAIDREFPAEIAPEDGDMVTIVTEALARSHRLLVDGALADDIVRNIAHFVSQQNKIVLLSGAPGSGKTTIVSMWMHQHVCRYQGATPVNVVSKCIVSHCRSGPREDLRAHLFVATFLDHSHVEPTIEAVLHRLFTEIRRYCGLKQRVPSKLRLKDNFIPWMMEASKRGLVWLIDGIEKLRSKDFLWLNKVLYAVDSGLQVVVTCAAEREDIISVLTSISVGGEDMTIPKLDAGQMWSMHSQYLDIYGLEPDDEIIWRIVNAQVVKHPMHLRTILMAHRVTTHLKLTSGTTAFENIVWALECSTPIQVFVGMMQRLKKAKHELAEIVLLIAISVQGLREAEILQLTEVNQFRYRKYCDILLDELMVTNLGFSDFQSVSLKQALRDAYCNDKKFWDEGFPRGCVERALQFFGDPTKVSSRRMAKEMPHLLVVNLQYEKLFDYLSNSINAGYFVSTQQIHMVEYYTQCMKLTMGEYVATIMLDFQERFGEKEVEDTGEAQKGGRMQSLTKALTRLFRGFGVHRQSVKKRESVLTSRIAFASRYDDSLSMRLPQWYQILEYLELMAPEAAKGSDAVGGSDAPPGFSRLPSAGPTLDSSGLISRKDAAKIFYDLTAQQEGESELVFNEFRTAMVQVAKKIGIQLTDLLREALRTAQLRQLFNHFATGGKHTGDVSTGQVGKRARTMDFKEYSGALEHLGLFKSLTKFEAHQFFKAANTSEEIADDDASELAYAEFRSCIESICEQLVLSMDDLIHTNVIDTLKGLDPRAGASFTFNMEKMTPERRQEFLDCALGLASLFSLSVPLTQVTTGADEGAIDVSQLILCSCHKTENFSELHNESTKIVFGKVKEVIKAFSIYADCCCRLAENMVSDDKEKQARRVQLEEARTDLEMKEAARKHVYASSMKHSYAARQEEEEMQAAHAKKIEKLAAEINDVIRDANDNLSELRWLRRRSTTAAVAAQRLKRRMAKRTSIVPVEAIGENEMHLVEMQQPNVYSTSTLDSLLACLDMFESDVLETAFHSAHNAQKLAPADSQRRLLKKVSTRKLLGMGKSMKALNVAPTT